MAKELTIQEMLLEIIQRQTEMCAMLEAQGEILSEHGEKLDEIEQKVEEIAMIDWENPEEP